MRKSFNLRNEIPHSILIPHVHNTSIITYIKLPYQEEKAYKMNIYKYILTMLYNISTEINSFI